RAASGAIAVDATATSSRARPVISIEWQISQDGGSTWAAATPGLQGSTYTFSGLTNGVDYVIRGRSTGWVGDSAWVVVDAARPIREPAVPIIRSVSPGSGRVFLRFDLPSSAAAPVERVRWELSTAGGAWQALVTSTSSPGDTNLNLTGLTNGVDYRLRLRTGNTTGNSPSVTTVSFRPFAVPLAPELTGVTAGDGSITAATVVSSTAARPVDTLEWQISAGPGEDWQPVAPTGAGPHVFTGLPNGVDQRLRVRSVNDRGTSAWVTSETVRPVTVPVAPHLSIVSATSGRIEAAGLFPSSDAAPAAGREWQISEIVDGVAINWRTVAPATTGTANAFGGLTDGTDYRLRARSLAPQGASAGTETSTVRPIHAPAAPVMTGVSGAEGSLVVDVDFPTGDAAPSRAADAEWQLSHAGGAWQPVGPTGTGSAVIEGLVDGDSYRVRVRAVNDAGSSDWVESAPATPTAAPGAPSLGAPLLRLGGFEIPVVQPASPGAPVASLEWELARVIPGEAPDWSAAVPTSAGSGTWRFEGLTEGVDYRVRVRAVGPSSTGPWAQSETVRPIAVAEAPVIGEIETGNGELRVSARFPTSTTSPSSSAEARWEIAVDSETPQVYRPVIPTRAPDGTFVFSGLATGESYRLRVQAVNAVGSSSWVDAVAHSALAAVPATPSVDDLSVGSGVLEVRAVHPVSAGAPVTGREWQIRTVSSLSTWSTVVPTVQAEGRFRFSGLVNGTDYQVRTRSVNDAGSSPWVGSAVGRPVAIPADPALSSLTVSDGRLDLTATFPSSVAAPSDPDAAIWRIREADASVPTWRVVAPLRVGDRYTISGLENATAYELDVQAVNTSGASARSGTSFTPYGSPRPLTIETVTVGSDSLRVDLTIDESSGSRVTTLVWQIWSVDGTGHGQWTTVPATRQSDGSYLISGLAPGQEYQLRAQGSNATGATPWAGFAGILTPSSTSAAGPRTGTTPVSAADTDGDGIPNESDLDVDGDGIPNADDTDIDGDGVSNTADVDMDGDGVVNASDPDIDGDGVPNASDPTPAGPGSTTGSTGVGSTGDVDGDGIPNASDPDVDGDGVNNVFD
ncbi:MAG: fibronectin type III domain-containing protein, partial [Naasia sp.]